MNPLSLPCRAHCTKFYRYGNINPLSIAYATRLGLGPTNPGMITIVQETSLFRPTGFSPVLKLLIPAFSLDTAPPSLTTRLHRNINAPLPLYVNVQSISSVIHLSPVTFSTQDLLTSELLRTL